MVTRRLLLVFLFVLTGCSAGGQAAGDCEPATVLSEGDRLPDCSFERLDGSETVDLSSLTGRPVVLNFWASWCISCLEEMPDLDAYAKANPGIRVVGVDVVGLQGETVELGRRYYAERKVSYESLADRDGQLFRHFNARATLPLTVVLDADGVIRARRFGKLDEASLKALVDDALA